MKFRDSPELKAEKERAIVLNTILGEKLREAGSRWQLSGDRIRSQVRIWAEKAPHSHEMEEEFVVRMRAVTSLQQEMVDSQLKNKKEKDEVQRLFKETSKRDRDRVLAVLKRSSDSVEVELSEECPKREMLQSALDEAVTLLERYVSSAPNG
jgi:hypothetical protein